MARTGRARRRWISLGIGAGSLAVLLGALVGGVGWYRAKLVRDAREKGMALYEEGKFSEALEPLSFYVSRRREDVEALIRLGTARAAVFVENNRHLVSASAFLEAALKRDPTNVEALRALIPIYRQLGYRIELVRVADTLLSVDPRDARALEARLAARIDQGAWEEAARDAELLVELEPDSVRWRGTLLDILRFAERPIEQRLALVDLWIAGGEPDGRYRLLRAEQRMLEGKLDEAKAECALAADRGISELISLERLVELMQLLGLEEDLDRTLDVSRQRFGAPLIGRLEGRLHFLGGRNGEAQRTLDSLWEAGEKSDEIARLRVMVAELADDVERSDRAMLEFQALAPEASLERARNDAWTRAIRSSRAVVGPVRREGVRVTAADRRAAREALIRALQLWPDDSFLLYRLGEMNLAAGEFPAGRQLIESAFQAESRRWALAGIRAAHGALRSNATDDAFRIAREVVMRHPRSTLAYIGFAEALSALSREGRVPSMVDPTLPRGLTASAILEQVYEVLDRDPAILVPYVVALVDEGRSKEALDVAIDATTREKPDIATLCGTVGPLLASGEIDGVDTLLGKLRGIDPDAFEVRIAAVDLLIARDELGRAAEESAAIVASVPEGDVRIATALRQGARIASLREDPQAIGILTRYLASAEGDPDAAPFVLGQSVTWTDEGLVRQAIEHMRITGGEGSQQVVLADASRVLAFHRGDGKAIAAATMSVNQILRENPNVPSALIVIARLLSASVPPDWTRASSFLAKAVDLQPRETSLYAELVVLLQKAGNTVDATRYLQQYLRLSGQDQDATRRATRLLLNQGAFIDALPVLERLSGQTGGETDLLVFAEANRVAGRVTAAEEIYRRAATRSGRSAIAVQAYSEFLARLGRVEEARKVIGDDATSANPVLSEADRVIFLLRLESIYGTEESMEAVNRQIESISDGDPRIVATRAQQALRRGDDAAALRIAQEGLVRFPEDESLLGMTASLLIADRASRDGASEVLDRLGRTRPEWRDLLELLRTAGGTGDELDLSEATLDRALELTDNHPLFSEGWRLAVSMHLDAGRTEEAIRIARRAVTRLPSNSDVAAMAAMLLADVGRTEEAREAALSWKRLVPENTLAADTLLASLLLSSNPAEAVKVLSPHREILRSDPARNVRSLELLVLALLASGDRESAAELALASGSAGPVLAAWTRGARAVSPADASAMLDRIPLANFPDDVQLGLAAEYSALASRGVAEAASKARAILDGLPANLAASPFATLLRADLSVAEGRREEAVAAYEAFIAGFPPALIQSFETSPGGTLAPEAEASRVQYLYALNNAASAEIAPDGNRDRGLRTVERALRAGGDQVFLQDTRVQLLLAVGDVAGARSAATAATTADRNSLEAWLAFAEAELAAGRLESVERALREVERIAAGSIIVEFRSVERRKRLETGLAQSRANRERA